MSASPGRYIEEIKKVFQQMASLQGDSKSINCFEFVKGMQKTERFQHCTVDELKVWCVY